MTADALSPLDSAFLRLEGRRTSLHIACVAVFEGPTPSAGEMSDHFGAKLALLPRYRQRLQEFPLRLGQPVWVDDPDFDLDRHLLRTALPTPGSPDQLEALMGRLMSQQLDRSRPLWQCWVVDGLADGRWAMINKVHHCLVDGIAGTDLLGLVLDPSPVTAPVTAVPWSPAPGPGPFRMLAASTSHAPRRGVDAVRRLSAAGRRPRSSARTALRNAHGLVGLAGSLHRGRPSSLLGDLGADRCWRSVTASLDDVRDIRQAWGGTVNDVVVAAVTQGFRDLLLHRGETLPARGVLALIPVSVRTATAHIADNQVSAMLASLPVGVPDLRARFEAVRGELDRVKRSGESDAVHGITGAAAYVPPALAWTVLTLGFRLPQGLVTTVVTNLPGPREPLYGLGRRLLELHPYVPIADQVRIGVAITSYCGRLFFGVTADRDSTPDISVLVDGIEAGIRDLHQAVAQSDD